ncbi:MAG: SGNH/GDSL hydrolase family protein [Actinobacteria bacterium]|nr:SGNH/GDSL hydrolase family protein [Actinomycetota bacterium]
MSEPLRLVVVGDSFAFTDHRGPQLPDEPTLFPNVAADRLRTALGRPVRAWTVARAGWGVREVWRAVTKDRHVQFEVLGEADAVILAVGSYDHLPAGVPPALETLAPFLRPARLRRGYRRLLGAVTPRSIRATGGRFRRVPVREFARLYDAILGQVRGLTHGAPTVALGPAGHDADRYGRRNPHLRSGEAVQERIAARHGVAFAPIREFVAAHVGSLNPDGIHWPPAVHAAVGGVAGTALAEQLTGERPSPPDPWDDLPT